jgi:hypothetical protein
MSVDRFRTYWRGLVIAAAVSLRQLGESSTASLREPPPYVLIDERNDHDRFSPGERVGHSILTVPLPESDRFSRN